MQPVSPWVGRVVLLALAAVVGLVMWCDAENEVIKRDFGNHYLARKNREEISDLCRLGTLPAMIEARNRITAELEVRGTAVDSRGNRFHLDIHVDKMKWLHERLTELIEQLSSPQTSQ